MLRTIHDASRNDESRDATSMLLAGVGGQYFRNVELAPGDDDDRGAGLQVQLEDDKFFYSVRERFGHRPGTQCQGSKPKGRSPPGTDVTVNASTRGVFTASEVEFEND